MNKRQRKKRAREYCPKCGSGTNVGAYYYCTTGRLVREVVWCPDCGYTCDPHPQKRYLGD